VKQNLQNARIRLLPPRPKHAAGKSSSKVNREGPVEEITCQEWARTLKQYQAAVTAYCEAALELPVRLGARFNKAWLEAENLRRATEDVRAALFEHEHEHGCSRWASPLHREKPIEPLDVA